jgi:hypothetical protein
MVREIASGRCVECGEESRFPLIDRATRGVAELSKLSEERVDGAGGGEIKSEVVRHGEDLELVSYVGVIDDFPDKSVIDNEKQNGTKRTALFDTAVDVESVLRKGQRANGRNG